MKKFWEISSRRALFWFLGWLLVSDLLVVFIKTYGWWQIKVLLFLSLVLLPGVALLRVLRIVSKNLSTVVLYSFGLSILVLMLSGLLVNEFLPLFGASNPLSVWWALGGWSAVTLAIIVVGFVMNKDVFRIRKCIFEGLSKPAWLLLILSLLPPFFAAAGAFRLNNGGDGAIAMIALGFILVLIVYAFLLRRRLPDGLLTWLIFSIGLSILLMTSLRGWDITGHDIEREFRVYTMTHMNALWNIALDRDPYNACLSITILPEMFARLLDVSGLVVFKVLLQIVFAACPAAMYVILRRFVPKLGALAGCLLFICYPTFINDSAMLTRQGIAYLFFTLVLLVMTSKAQNMRHKILFLLVSLGVVLSHYSTAYMFVGIFIIAAIFKLLIIRLHTRRSKKPLVLANKTVLSPLFAVLIFAMTFMWYVQITGTSNGLMSTISKSFANIPSIFSNDNKSSDTSSALLFANDRTQVDLYQSYLTQTQPRNVANSKDELQYLAALVDDNLPLTPLGARLRAAGVDPSIIANLRQDYAKVLQVLALLGVIFVTYSLLRRKKSSPTPDMVCLSLAGIVLLALIVVLPVLSVNYGVLRAFQQALIILILPIILLLMSISRRANLRVVVVTTTVGVSMLFLLFTGIFAQLLGGASPSLSLNNQGLYYGLYNLSAADAYGFAWLREHIPTNKDVRAVNFNKTTMYDPQYPFARSGILPSQIENGTYVYLDPAQVLLQKVYAYHESSPLIMTFPDAYYDVAKSQIYSTRATAVYR